MKATDQRTRQKALAKGASTHESGLHNASNADFFNGITALRKSAVCPALPKEVANRISELGRASSPLSAHKQNSSRALSRLVLQRTIAS